MEKRFLALRIYYLHDRKVVDLKIKGFQKLLRKENKSQAFNLRGEF